MQDSEKYLGYAICQACKIYQTFCRWAWQGPKWHNAFRYCSAVIFKLWYVYQQWYAKAFKVVHE